jgi:hypothetical protein
VRRRPLHHLAPHLRVCVWCVACVGVCVWCVCVCRAVCVCVCKYVASRGCWTDDPRSNQTASDSILPSSLPLLSPFLFFTWGDPVKMILSTSGQATRAAPASPRPVTTFFSCVFWWRVVWCGVVDVDVGVGVWGGRKGGLGVHT